MSSLLTILMLVILFASVATLYTEGMWSNAIRLVNTVTAALLAVNFFEPLARWMESQAPTFTYVWDFLALWLLFALFTVILRLLTDQVSRVQVRFLKLADQIGSTIFSLWIGWVLVCFTMLTLHTAPLSQNFLYGGFTPREHMLLGFAPDRQWLGFVQSQSMGAFSQPATPEESEKEKYVFDPNADFMPKYSARRAALESQVATKGTLRTAN
jgi:uncharacterized membrane protein required for colicin V production